MDGKWTEFNISKYVNCCSSYSIVACNVLFTVPHPFVFNVLCKKVLI